MNWRKIFDIFKPKAAVVSKIKILIIDDSPTDQKVAHSAVSRGGYQTLIANNGEEGIALAKAQQPDLIILDYHMPGLNGSETCRILKNDKETAKIPVLFLTSNNTPEGVVNCFEDGAVNFLAKPIAPNFLLQQIRLALTDKN